jgi:ribosomal protein S18 acetylase RimI-like enzyme
MLEAKIRRFKPGDESEIYRICADTGIRGDPIDELFMDRELFARLVVEPAIKLRPQNAFVAEQEGKIVGYVLGEFGEHFERKSLLIRARVAGAILLNYVTGKYASHPNSKTFVKYMLTKIWKEIPKTPKNTPSLHINLDKCVRGSNLGERLLHEFEFDARHLGHKSYHGVVFSDDTRRTPALYESMGFEIYDRVLTTHFAPVREQKMYLMTVVKKL